MRKSLIITGAALLSAGLAGCQSEQFVQEQSANSEAIQVRATTPVVSSRAAESYCANNLPPTFTLWAKTSVDAPEPDLIYFRDKTLSRADGGYVFENGTPFWPKEGNLDFFAFRSDEGTFNRSVHTPKFEHYTIKNEVPEQLDLLYGVTRNASREEGPVMLNFRHALAQVVFRAKVSNPSIEVVVHDVSIAGRLYNQGTFTFPADTETTTNWLDESHSDDPETIYPDDLGLGTWDDYATTVDFPGEYTAQTDETPILSDSGVKILTQSPEGHGAEGWEQVMTLLPQKQEAFNPKESAHATGTYLKVNCTISNVAAEEGDAKVLVHEGYAYIPLEIDWKQGVRYIYTLNFGSDKATSIGDFYPIEIDCTCDDFLPYEDPAERHGTVNINFWTNDGETCFKSIDFVKDIHNSTLTLPTTAPRELLGEVKEISGWSTTPGRDNPEFLAGSQFEVDFSKEEINLYLNTGFLYTVNYWEWVEDELDDNGPGGHYVLSEKYPSQTIPSNQPNFTYYLPNAPAAMQPENLSRYFGKNLYMPGVDWTNKEFTLTNYAYHLFNPCSVPAVEWCGWAKKDNLEQYGVTAYSISSDDPVLNLYSVWRYNFCISCWFYSYETVPGLDLGTDCSRVFKSDYNTTRYVYIENAQGPYVRPTWDYVYWHCNRMIMPEYVVPVNGISFIGFSKTRENPVGVHTLDECDYTFNTPIILHPYVEDDWTIVYAVFGSEEDVDICFD